MSSSEVDETIFELRRLRDLLAGASALMARDATPAAARLARGIVLESAAACDNALDRLERSVIRAHESTREHGQPAKNISTAEVCK